MGQCRRSHLQPGNTSASRGSLCPTHTEAEIRRESRGQPRDRSLAWQWTPHCCSGLEQPAEWHCTDISTPDICLWVVCWKGYISGVRFQQETGLERRKSTQHSQMTFSQNYTTVRPAQRSAKFIHTVWLCSVFIACRNQGLCVSQKLPKILYHFEAHGIWKTSAITLCGHPQMVNTW